jgi:hypothetical protein
MSEDLSSFFISYFNKNIDYNDNYYSDLDTIDEEKFYSEYDCSDSYSDGSNYSYCSDCDSDIHNRMIHPFDFISDCDIVHPLDDIVYNQCDENSDTDIASLILMHSN